MDPARSGRGGRGGVLVEALVMVQGATVDQLLTIINCVTHTKQGYKFPY